VVKLQVYIDTLNVVVGPVKLAQLMLAPPGSVIVQVTAPLGTMAFGTPLTVVVKVVVPPIVGLEEAESAIVGYCLFIDRVMGLLDTPL